MKHFWMLGVLALARPAGGAGSPGGEIIGDPQGGFAVLTPDLVGHYYDRDGQEVWPVDGIPVASDHRGELIAARFNKEHALVAVWKEPTAAGFLWKAQALARSGERLWSDAGVLLHDPGSDYAAVAVTMDAGANVILAWQERAPALSRLHVQRWGAKGLPEWGDSGRVIDFPSDALEESFQLYATDAHLFALQGLRALKLF